MYKMLLFLCYFEMLVQKDGEKKNVEGGRKRAGLRKV